MVVTGRKAIMHRYPAVSGLTAETTSQEGRVSKLVAENSIIPEREKEGVE